MIHSSITIASVCTAKVQLKGTTKMVGNVKHAHLMPESFLRFGFSLRQQKYALSEHASPNKKPPFSDIKTKRSHKHHYGSAGSDLPAPAASRSSTMTGV